MDPKKYVGGDYLNADSVKSENLTNKNLLIVDVVEREFDKGVKLSLKFAEIDKELVLNNTNNRIMMKKFGENDTELWKNKIIQLSLVGITFKGQLVDSIQVSPIDQQPEVATPTSNNNIFIKKGNGWEAWRERVDKGVL